MLLKCVNFLYIIICISFFFSICTGCSKSGLKHRAEKNSEKGSSTDYSKRESLKNPSENTQPSKSELSLNQLYQKYQSSVFMVFTSDGEQGYQGTGFFISEDGIAVSNYHVFEGTSRGLEVIKTYNGKVFQVEKVLAQNKEIDYIIFKVEPSSNEKFNPIPIAKQKPNIGEDVFAIGNPRGLEHTLSKGIVSGYRSNDNLIQTTTEITHGSSGSPLLNMRGEVVGITNAGLGEANLNFAVNIKSLPLQRFI